MDQHGTATQEVLNKDCWRNEWMNQRHLSLHPCTLTPKSHWTSAPRHLAKSLILKEVCPQDIEGKVAFGTDWVVDVVSVLSQDESFVR